MDSLQLFSYGGRTIFTKHDEMIYITSTLIGLVLGRRPLGAILHSSNEPGELSQWLCHDDSAINIVVLIIIIIITIG